MSDTPRAPIVSFALLAVRLSSALLLASSVAAGQVRTLHPPTLATPSTGAATLGPFACGTEDSGTSNNALGLAPGGELAWLQEVTCFQHVTALRTAYGTAQAPGTVTNGAGSQLGLWVDGDCNGDPSDGLTLAFSLATTVTNANTDVLNTFPVSPPVYIPSHCAWIGASADHQSAEFPAPMDQTNAANAWVVGSTAGPGTLDLNNLNAAGVPLQEMAAIGLTTAFLLRAQGIEAGSAQPGELFGFCDGTGTPGPCANPGIPGAGCGNSVAPEGCIFHIVGDASISGDSLTLMADNALGGQPGLFFQGDQQLVPGDCVVFGDGLRCVGGNVTRLQTVTPIAPPGAAGNATTTITITTHPGVNLSPGDVRYYQFWYRDPNVNFCTAATFNLSSAIEVQWGP